MHAIKKQMRSLIFATKNWKQRIIKAAKLYYDLGQFRAAGVAFATLLNQLS